jgi:hypothetical protein
VRARPLPGNPADRQFRCNSAAIPLSELPAAATRSLEFGTPLQYIEVTPARVPGSLGCTVAVLSMSKQELATALWAASTWDGAREKLAADKCVCVNEDAVPGFHRQGFRPAFLRSSLARRSSPIRSQMRSNPAASWDEAGRNSCCERGRAANRPCRRKPTPPPAAAPHLIATLDGAVARDIAAGPESS